MSEERSRCEAAPLAGGLAAAIGATTADAASCAGEPAPPGGVEGARPPGGPLRLLECLRPSDMSRAVGWDCRRTCDLSLSRRGRVLQALDNDVVDGQQKQSPEEGMLR